MLNWQNIDHVFLDMDGTLLDLHFDNHFWLEHLPLRYAENNKLSVGQAKQQLYPKIQALRGQLQWYSIDFWEAELNLPILKLKQEVAHLIQSRPQALAFLKKLQSLPLKVILFTNAQRSTVDLKMQQVPLRSYFDKIITSHELGLPKEADGAWQAVQQREPFDATRSLFVDDNFDVLSEAKRYGIGHLFGITKPDSQRPALEHSEFKLLNNYQTIMPV